MILCLCMIVAFARNPIGLFAIVAMIFSLLLLNNKFAESAGLAITKLAKQISPQLSAVVSALLSQDERSYFHQ